LALVDFDTKVTFFKNGEQVEPDMSLPVKDFLFQVIDFTF